LPPRVEHNCHPCARLSKLLPKLQAFHRSTVAFDEAGEAIGADAIGEGEAVRSWSSLMKAVAAEAFEVRGDLAGFAACFNEALALLLW